MYFSIMKERITIKDIAKALNIHHSTVSRALRNDAKVKENTREIIQSYAKKHGYQINKAALELRGEKSNTLAIIVPNISHYFFSNVVSYITNLVSDEGFVVSIFQTNESVEREKALISTVVQNNYAGVMASLSMETKETEHFELLNKHRIPLVMFDRVGKHSDASKVTIDNQGIMLKALSLLVEKGYKKIAHISGPSYMNVFGDRQLGYKKGIKKYGLSYKKIITISKDFSRLHSVKIASELFDENERPDAIISDSSNLLYGLIKEIRLRDLHIPNDIGFIVFGEYPALEVLQPPITSIIQPVEEIAKMTFDLLKDKIKNLDSISRNIQLMAKIELRESI